MVHFAVESKMAEYSEELPGGSEELSTIHSRLVYLITYSQVEVQKVPTREAFVNIVVEAVNSIGADIKQWVCCEENHEQGGVHYHIAIKLSKRHRWLQIKRYIEAHYSVVTHFSSLHSNYYSAWRYVTKSDEQCIESEGHPDLTDNLPRTLEASLAKRERCTGGKAPKKKRMSAFEVSEVIRSKNIKTETELLALAEEQRVEGKTNLAEFVVNRGPKWVSDTLKVKI